MWKALVVGTTMLTIAGSTLASAQQPAPAERSQRAQLTADDIAAQLFVPRNQILTSGRRGGGFAQRGFF